MRDLENGYHIVTCPDDLKIVERTAGYRGHDNPRLDVLYGDEPETYPAIAHCEFAYEDSHSRSCYCTTVITVDMAWALIWAQAEARANAKLP